MLIFQHRTFRQQKKKEKTYVPVKLLASTISANDIKPVVVTSFLDRPRYSTFRDDKTQEEQDNDEGYGLLPLTNNEPSTSAASMIEIQKSVNEDPRDFDESESFSFATGRKTTSLLDTSQNLMNKSQSFVVQNSTMSRGMFDLIIEMNQEACVVDNNQRSMI